MTRKKNWIVYSLTHFHKKKTIFFEFFSSLISNLQGEEYFFEPFKYKISVGSEKTP